MTKCFFYRALVRSQGPHQCCPEHSTCPKSKNQGALLTFLEEHRLRIFSPPSMALRMSWPYMISAHDSLRSTESDELIHSGYQRMVFRIGLRNRTLGRFSDPVFGFQGPSSSGSRVLYCSHQLWQYEVDACVLNKLFLFSVLGFRGSTLQYSLSTCSSTWLASASYLHLGLSASNDHFNFHDSPPTPRKYSKARGFGAGLPHYWLYP